MKKELADKQQCIAKLQSKGECEWKPQLEIKSKELREARAKEKVRMTRIWPWEAGA